MKLSLLFGANIRRARSEVAMTLLELLVAAACGLIILGAFVAVTMNINSMVRSAGNYGDLDEYSRNTLDMLSRDVRNATTVDTSSTSTNLIIENTFQGTTQITYWWDGSNVVMRTYGNMSPQVLLTNCNYLNFDYFTKAPQPDLQFNDYTNGMPGDEIKLVSVSWRCSRSVLGAKLNTESVQTAQIVVRN